MLLVHSLEKGMCHKDKRPFGVNKALTLVNLLKKSTSEQTVSFEYKLACSVLMAWLLMWDNNGWNVSDIPSQVIEWIKTCKPSELCAGITEYSYIPNTEFADVVLSRHSAREFQNNQIRKKDLDFALSCFSVAPSACNRQMCKVYLVKDKNLRILLSKTILGLSGFDMETTTLFVVTYDNAALHYSGERNQGMLNAGLAAMNFVNGLHARGIGSCFMEWSNEAKEDAMIRKALKLKSSERIAVTIGAGYYVEKSIIPCSCRRPIDSVFHVL